MKVCVVGGTGFTGSYVVKRLLDKKLDVSCLVRPTSSLASIPESRVQRVVGDLDDPRSLENAFAGSEALIFVASMGFGQVPGVIEELKRSQIRRAVFFSSTSIFTKLNPLSKGLRMAAEEAVKLSGLDYTILRPTMIYGDGRDRNIARLIRYVAGHRLILVPGSGTRMQQPVFVDDLAGAAVASILSPCSVGKEYELSGREPITFTRMIEEIGQRLGRGVRRLHLPIRPIILGLRLSERIGLKLPIKAEQIERLEEDKAFDWSRAADDFGYDPRSFEQGLDHELRSMGFV